MCILASTVVKNNGSGGECVFSGKKAGFKDVEFQILKGFRHETLNEIGREHQMEAFADWLDRVTG